PATSSPPLPPPTPPRSTPALHDALPISRNAASLRILSSVKTTPEGLFGEFTKIPFVCSLTAASSLSKSIWKVSPLVAAGTKCPRSEEHTSELQSRFDLVCRLLLEKGRCD